MILSPSELRPEREWRGLSRPALALLSGVSAGVIGRIETSGRASCATMQALSDALIGKVKVEDVHFWREWVEHEARIAALADQALAAFETHRRELGMPKDALRAGGAG